MLHPPSALPPTPPRPVTARQPGASTSPDAADPPTFAAFLHDAAGPARAARPEKPSEKGRETSEETARGDTLAVAPDILALPPAPPTTPAQLNDIAPAPCQAGAAIEAALVTDTAEQPATAQQSFAPKAPAQEASTQEAPQQEPFNLGRAPARTYEVVEAGASAIGTTDAGGKVAPPPPPPAIPASTLAASPLAAPPQAAASPAHAPVAVEAVPMAIATLAQEGMRRFEIRLDPADLGRIDIRLDVDADGSVRTHLIVERPGTLQQLQQDAPRLEQALNAAGAQAERGSVSFSLKQEHPDGHGRSGPHPPAESHIDAEPQALVALPPARALLAFARLDLLA